jgi:hypothetical protein
MPFKDYLTTLQAVLTDTPVVPSAPLCRALAALGPQTHAGAMAVRAGG